VTTGKEVATLPDILEDDLDIVFVGINPGVYSAEQRHYYAHPTNLFWPMLYQCGLIPKLLKPEEDWKLTRFRMGLTDTVKRVTESAKDLSASERREGGEILRRKIRFYSPRTVCFNGLSAYSALFGRCEGPGPKDPLIGTSRLFVLPSTSRRNAYYQKDDILHWFTQLRLFSQKSLL